MEEINLIDDIYLKDSLFILCNTKEFSIDAATFLSNIDLLNHPISLVSYYPTEKLIPH